MTDRAPPHRSSSVGDGEVLLRCKDDGTPRVFKPERECADFDEVIHKEPHPTFHLPLQIFGPSAELLRLQNRRPDLIPMKIVTAGK